MSDVRDVIDVRRRQIHVPEGTGTFGKRDARGVPRLYVTVHDEHGNVVYETWQAGPLADWKRTTLYFDKVGLDADGRKIGLSFWD